MICPICRKNHASEEVKRSLGALEVRGAVCANCLVDAYAMEDEEFFRLFYLLPQKKCKACGRSFGEISETLLVGCGACYSSFEREIEPLIKSLQRTER